MMIFCFCAQGAQKKRPSWESTARATSRPRQGCWCTCRASTAPPTTRAPCPWSRSTARRFLQSRGSPWSGAATAATSRRLTTRSRAMRRRCSFLTTESHQFYRKCEFRHTVSTSFDFLYIYCKIFWRGKTKFLSDVEVVCALYGSNFPIISKASLGGKINKLSPFPGRFLKLL